VDKMTKAIRIALILLLASLCAFWVLGQQSTQGTGAAAGARSGQDPAQGRGAGVQDAAARGQRGGRGARGGVQRKRVLAWADTRNGVAQHESVAHFMAVIERLGYESGLWDTLIRTDSNIISKTAKKTDGTPASGGPSLSNVDAIFFQGHREVPLDAAQKEELLQFVREGHGLVAVHVGLTAFESWPEWVNLLGGRFQGHPISGAGTVINEDPNFPATKHFAPSFPFSDEFYLPKDYDRAKIHVLLRLDVKPDDTRVPGGDYPLAWAQLYGKGRVFFGSFGHTNETWDIRDVQQMYFEAMRWALGMTDAALEPHPMRGAVPAAQPAAQPAPKK
jgi:type 1 glutamine amidotransferase